LSGLDKSSPYKFRFLTFAREEKMLSCLKFFISLLILFSIFPTLPIFAQPQPLQTNPDSIPFAPAVNYGAGDGPFSVFCADLDGDGDLDLAVANENSDNVSILKNNGDGTFQTAVNYGAGNGPFSVFCADLDGDGDLELAVANLYSDNVSILKNNGDGTFQTAVNYGAGDYPFSVFCADLDGEGDLDLAVANAGSDNVSILKNNGNGTFQTKLDYGVGDGPQSVFCADLDGDSDLDLAVANYYSDYVSILKNNGDGTFQTTVNYGAGDGPWSVFCADLDGEGDLDLAVANEYSDNVSILKNNGDGTFQTKVDYGAGDRSYSVFCANLDGDTDLDLAVANAWSDNVSILKNNGNGTFQSAVNYGAGGGPYSVFCADLDGDVDLDLAVANAGSDNISVLLNLSISNSRPAVTSPDSSKFLCASDTIRFTVTASDPNPTDTLTLFGPDMSAPVTGVSPLSVEISIYANSPGTFNYVYTVTDSWGATDVDTSTWTITFNSTPTVVAVDSSLFFCDPDTIRFTVTASDPDVADTITLFGPGISAPLQGVSPLSADVAIPIDSTGNYSFIYTVSDLCLASGEDTGSWMVTVNSQPAPFSLLSPAKKDSVRMPETLSWHASLDSCPAQNILYELHLSQSPVFNPDSIADDSISDTSYIVDNLPIKDWYWKVRAYDNWGASTWSSDTTWSFYVFLTGDVNADGKISLVDVVYLAKYVLQAGSSPIPMKSADVDCDSKYTLVDVIRIARYVLFGEPFPC
jgi:ankyrin repeat protein